MNAIVSILIAVLVLWQQPPASSIQGTVVKAGTNEPIPGITLELRRAGTQPALASSAVTAADGKFLLQNVPLGEYRVIANDPTGRFVRTEYLQRHVHGRGIVLAIAGEGLRDLRISMPQSGSISGRVVDTDGEPAVNARVMALEAVYRDGQPVFSIIQALRANDDGEYRLFWLPPGQYFVAVQPVDARSASFATQVVPAGRSVFREDGATPVVARRILESGETIEEVFVTSYYGSGTDPQRARAINVGSGQNVGAIDISLTDTKVRVYHVRGTITNAAGQPASNVVVRLLSKTYRGPYTNVPNASSDSQGNFDIAGVLPGSYYLLAVLGGQLFGGQQYGGFRGPGINLNNGTSALVDIEVGSRDLPSVRVTITPGISMPIRASVEGGSINLSAVTVTLVRNPYLLGMPNAQSARLSNDGTARFDGIGPGDYSVDIAGLPDGSYVKSMRNGSMDVLGGGLHVTDAAAGALELVLSVNGGRIEGVTRSASGELSANVTVALVPEAPRRVQSSLYRTATSDRDGRFTIQGTAPGDYSLFAWESVEEGSWQNAAFLSAYEARGKVVHVTEGGMESVPLTVIPSGNRP